MCAKSDNANEAETLIAENTLLAKKKIRVDNQLGRSRGKSRRMKLLERMGCFGTLPDNVTISRATTPEDLDDGTDDSIERHRDDHELPLEALAAPEPPQKGEETEAGGCSVELSRVERNVQRGRARRVAEAQRPGHRCRLAMAAPPPK